ncbi:dihydroxyacetone kinase subunit DhaL [Irregularibacter muris]|uniref:phosphoenolpyruvate--glycerone phosphotransferase n=1 Tax=Irregularibacter muris TaxID=1796619 RepID=A0AAE3L360_9FIRM|nr:dihydroxyacetone kinase subunit DhaL [Irregularibacter muris]MCR1897693.1 dihydroxyacetone kinase subunit DhaL [Irregularibacter muris]
MITSKSLLKIIQNIAEAIKSNKEYLTDLDNPIGDSDHGINMSKGFTAVLNKLEDLKDKDCGTILKTVAMTLISTVGGASGPLYGTAFLKSSMVVSGKMDIDKQDAVKIFYEAIEGIKIRGKAQKGDKTMLDALIPAHEALEKAVENGEDTIMAFERAAIAAQEGVEFTKTIIARKGRASYLGERSIGHQDPGATSSYIIIREIANTLKS